MKKLIYISNMLCDTIYKIACRACDDGRLVSAGNGLDLLRGHIIDHATGKRDLEDYEFVYDRMEALLDRIHAHPTVIAHGQALECNEAFDTIRALEIPVVQVEYVESCDQNCGLCCVDCHIEGPLSGPEVVEVAVPSEDPEKYYSQGLGDVMSGAGDVSSDDIKRHKRERLLGFAPADPTWAESHRVIRCIWPNQKITRPIDRDNEFLKFAPAIACLDIYYNRVKDRAGVKDVPAAAVSNPATLNPEDFLGMPELEEHYGLCIYCRYSELPGCSAQCSQCMQANGTPGWEPQQ